MSILDWVAWVLLVTGAAFFLAGTVGLLRFRDFYSRLHALTKADNVGLAFVAAGLALQAGSLSVAAKLAVVWGLAIFASATSCYLIGNSAQRPEDVRAPDPGEQRKSHD
jgi:multicomponent Na+:H+ antiporter subunit G